MKQTIKVQPVLTYTDRKGKKYFERADIFTFQDGPDYPFPIGMVDVGQTFYDKRHPDGGPIYQAIINGKVITCTIEIEINEE